MMNGEAIRASDAAVQTVEETGDVCDGCVSLGLRVDAIEAQLTQAREQAEALSAKLPGPVRKMLGLDA
jgi:hypothetical protein